MGFHRTRPGDATLRRILADLADRQPRYPGLGATRDPGQLIRDGVPRRHRLHHTRVRLGSGEARFDAARRALDAWTMFRVPGIELCWPDVLPRTGALVGVLAHDLGTWSFHPSRVVYADEEDGPIAIQAFGYGTLPGHALSGEERFAVEFQRGNDSVWFDLLSFSRPVDPLARLGVAWVHRLQRRFGQAAAHAMQAAMDETRPAAPSAGRATAHPSIGPEITRR